MHRDVTPCVRIQYFRAHRSVIQDIWTAHFVPQRCNMDDRLTWLVAIGMCLTSGACDRPDPKPDEDASTIQRHSAASTESSSPSETSASSKTSSADDTSSSSSSASSDSETRSTHRARGGWKVIDAHTHLQPYAYPIVRKIFERQRIRRAINLSGGHAPEARKAHLDRADQLPGRVALFFNVDWESIDDPDFGKQTADELEAAVREGFAGLKISKALGLEVKTEDGELLPVDTPRLDPLWKRAGELGVPVTIHTADPKAFFEKPDPDNERWKELNQAPDWSFHGDEYPSRMSLLKARDRMVARHPDTTFILAHMGNNPENLDHVENLLETHDNLVVDTSARIAEFGRHSAERVREFFLKFQDRILFGTDLGVQAQPRGDRLAYSLFLGSVREEPPTLEDIPVFYKRHWRYFETDRDAVQHPIPIQGDWKVHPIDLPDDVLAKIYWKNTERIVFAPWLGRRSAHHIVDRARSMTP